jgi:hypothetical protein
VSHIISGVDAPQVQAYKPPRKATPDVRRH